MSAQGHLSAFAIEAVAHGALGALSEEDRGGAALHLEACEQCRSRLEAVRQDRQRFDREIFPRSSPRVARTVGRRRLALWSTVALVPALAAALLLLPRHQSVADFGFKGGGALRVFARRGDRVFQVEEAQTLEPGDRLRFEVEPGGLPYLLIASVDGAGHPNIYVPFGGNQSLAVDPVKRFTSPGSIELDDALGPERLFALSSREPLSAETVAEALTILGTAGPAAVRTTTRLPVTVDSQASFLWEVGRE